MAAKVSFHYLSKMLLLLIYRCHRPTIYRLAYHTDHHTIKGSRGHGGRVVTLSPPTSESGVRFTALPQVGKLVVACRWSPVYSTEP